MNRAWMMSAEEFAVDVFGPETEVEIEDDGSAYITTPHGVLHVFFAFDRDEVTRMTLFP